jgi:hypothetical protein
MEMSGVITRYEKAPETEEEWKEADDEAML